VPGHPGLATHEPTARAGCPLWLAQSGSCVAGFSQVQLQECRPTVQVQNRKLSWNDMRRQTV